MDGEFQRLNGLNMMTNLCCSAAARNSKRGSGRGKRSREGCYESKIVGDRLYLGIIEAALHDSQQALDFAWAGGLPL